MVTYTGSVGLWRFFHMNPTTPAMTPKTTSVTVTPMAAFAPAEMEYKSVLFGCSSATQVIQIQYLVCTRKTYLLYCNEHLKAGFYHL